jgi:HEAT repeat protein
MRFVAVLAVCIGLAGCARAPATLVHGKPVAHWVEAARDHDPKVRKKAVDALGNVAATDSGALSALVAAVRDRDAKVRAEAILALLKNGPAAREAVPALEQARQDRDSTVRAYAAKALDKIQGVP